MDGNKNHKFIAVIVSHTFAFTSFNFADGWLARNFHRLMLVVRSHVSIDRTKKRVFKSVWFVKNRKRWLFRICQVRSSRKWCAFSQGFYFCSCSLTSSSIRYRYSHAGHIEEDFDVTPEMSTYLVAFMISDLVNTNASRGVQQPASLPSINIWTRSNVADMTKWVYFFLSLFIFNKLHSNFCLRNSDFVYWYRLHYASRFFIYFIFFWFSYAYNVTTKVLPFYERYFGINFKLPKIDMVAVPEFGFSAMENWGLITFRFVMHITIERSIFFSV